MPNIFVCFEDFGDALAIMTARPVDASTSIL